MGCWCEKSIVELGLQYTYQVWLVYLCISSGFDLMTKVNGKLIQDLIILCIQNNR